MNSGLNDTISNNNSEVYKVNVNALVKNVKTFGKNNEPNRSPIQSVFNFPAVEGQEILKPKRAPQKPFGKLPMAIKRSQTARRNRRTRKNRKTRKN